MSDRGDICNPRFASRPRTFAGLRFGSITPTDIDCSVDFHHGKTFIFTEGKTLGTSIEAGQREHLENLVKAIRAGGHKAFAVVIEYPIGDDEVDYASCRIAEWYYGDAWLQNSNDARNLASFYLWAQRL